MAKIAYTTINFRPKTLQRISIANAILEEYNAAGYVLTLRQLFYQHVARGLLENTRQAYNNLGNWMSDARMTGLTDWSYLVDRTRNVQIMQHWEQPADLIAATIDAFLVDRWAAQNDHVEVWIEKEALVGVIEQTCENLDLPHFAVRGYDSTSEMYSAAQRLLGQLIKGKNIIVFHLGDHDPSGIDMTRDNDERLFRIVWKDYARYLAKRGEIDLESQEDLSRVIEHVAQHLRLERIGLTMEQIEEQAANGNPLPPQNAKLTDSRAGAIIRNKRIVGIREGSYIDRFSELDESYPPEDRALATPSWELDALEPPVLIQIIRDAVEPLIDQAEWDKAEERQEQGRDQLQWLSDNWDQIVKDFNE